MLSLYNYGSIFPLSSYEIWYDICMSSSYIFVEHTMALMCKKLILENKGDSLIIVPLIVMGYENEFVVDLWLRNYGLYITEVIPR